MPKKLKCYNRQRKDGSSYTTCNKDIKENKPKAPPKKNLISKKVKINIKKPNNQRIETGTINKGITIKSAPKLKKKEGKVMSAVKKIEDKSKPKKANDFSKVNNPQDITKSAKIKKEIKTLLGNDNTLKMPRKDAKSVTNKALLSVRGDNIKTTKEVIKKYDKLPKNIKDNLALQIYGYEDILHKTFSNLKVLRSNDGRPFDRLYNP